MLRRGRPISQRELDQQEHDQTIGLAIAKAFRSFNHDLGMPWAAYRDQVILNEIRTMARANKRAKPRKGRLVPLDSVADDLVDSRSEVQFGVSILLCETLRLSLRHLSPAHRRAILAIAAEELGYAPPHKPSQSVRSKALRKIRDVPDR